MKKNLTPLLLPDDSGLGKALINWINARTEFQCGTDEGARARFTEAGAQLGAECERLNLCLEEVLGTLN